MASTIQVMMGQKIAGGGGPFDPLTVSGCKLWLKAQSLSLSDSDPITSWSDSSGNSNTATRTDTTIVYKTNIVNSLPVARLTANAQMTLTSPITTARTVVAVNYINNYNFQDEFFGTGSNTGIKLIDSPSPFTQAQWGGDFGTIYINGTATDLQNRVAWSVAVFIAGSNQTLNILSNYNSIGRFFNGDIGDLLVYDTALGTTDREYLEDGFGAKYGITIA